MDLKDFEIRLVRHIEANMDWFNICIQVRYPAYPTDGNEIVDYELMRLSTLLTPTDVNMEIKIRLDKLRNEFEAIL
jgi:hypothetical protein